MMTFTMQEGIALPARQIEQIIDTLAASYHSSGEKLRYRNSFELLVAAIMLTQSTVEEVNSITPSLFERYPTPHKMAIARRVSLFHLLHPSGFYRQKAKHIQLTSQILLTRHRGQVPTTLIELTKLPGVARKTAHLIVSELTGDVVGVPVDTRVRRVAKRLGLANGRSVEAVERQLQQQLAKRYWHLFADLAGSHGDALCHASDPECDRCPLLTLCPSAEKFGAKLP